VTAVAFATHDRGFESKDFIRMAPSPNPGLTWILPSFTISMNWDDWINALPGDRNAIRMQWHQRDCIRDPTEPWADLLKIAERKFAAEFEKHPLINRIASRDCRILVSTALYPPQFIEDIPGQYYHFLVDQHPINADRDHYLRYWSILFGELLGWTESDTHDWAKRWDNEMNDRVLSFFYHEDVYYYAAPQILVSSGLATLVHDTLLQRRIEDAIQKGHSSPIWGSPCDWDLVRERVNAVLQPFGGILPHR
jgi:hypothetical protein